MTEGVLLLPSSPYVDELLAASDLAVENDYGKYEVFLYPTYNLLPISINPICNSHPKLNVWPRNKLIDLYCNFNNDEHEVEFCYSTKTIILVKW